MLDRGGELIEIHRFAHVAVHPEIVPGGDVLLFGRGRQDYHRNSFGPGVAPNLLQYLQPGDTRQFQIEKNDGREVRDISARIGARTEEVGERLLAVLRDHQLICNMRSRERPLCQADVARVVFDKKNYFGVQAHSESRVK